MAIATSILKLHLQYRLLISEMNADINVLRIFEDYLQEILSSKYKSEIKKRVEYFKSNFIQLRKEIDDLRDEMHKKKMKLFLLSKENTVLDSKSFKADNHKEILKQFKAYRKKFDKIKKEFTRF